MLPSVSSNSFLTAGMNALQEGQHELPITTLTLPLLLKHSGTGARGEAPQIAAVFP